MRLTLRNMLAYTDNLLDPDASREIAKKIEESEFASSLLHRIRDVMRRTRLGAPSVMDREGGLDPNTMAEYIDTTLPTARVGDFEKVCLESDVHLAEVASCHQVLALVLGEPAEVDPNSRERMYHLPESLVPSEEEPAEQTTAPPPLEQAEAAVDRVGLPPRVKPSVPEYLQASRRRRRLVPIVGVALVLLLGLALLAATGQFKPGSTARGLLGLDSDDGGVDQSLAMSDETGPPNVPADESASDSPENDGLLQPQGPPEGISGREPNDEPDDSKPGKTAPLPPDLTTSVIPSVDSPPKAPGGTAPMGVGDAPRPKPADVASVEPKPGPLATDPNGGMSVPPVAAPGIKPAAHPGPAVDAGQAVAVFLDPDQVLLRFKPNVGWHRLAAEAPLMPGDQLLSFPTFRPTISFGGQVEITLIDGTQLQLTASGITVNYGRVIIKCSADGAAALRLSAAGANGVVTFGGVDSTLAVEVVRMPDSKADPETQPAPSTVNLISASGECRWKADSAGEPVALSPPSQIVFQGPTATVMPDGPGATWIVFDTTESLDRIASARIERGATHDSSVLVRLGELAEDRRREVRWLALDCLARIGEFERLVAMLDNRDERLGWADYVGWLKEAVYRDPTSAARVRSEMERQFGPDGAGLYEMLWGYGPDELNQEEAARLIGYLEHKTLAFRVLAFTTLYEITGFGFLYHPEEELAADRERAIKRWKDRLEDGFKAEAK